VLSQAVMCALCIVLTARGASVPVAPPELVRTALVAVVAGGAMLAVLLAAPHGRVGAAAGVLVGGLLYAAIAIAATRLLGRAAGSAP